MNDYDNDNYEVDDEEDDDYKNSIVASQMNLLPNAVTNTSHLFV